MSSIKLFENMQVRSHWDEQRLKAEGIQTVTNCHGLNAELVLNMLAKAIVTGKNAKRLK